MYVITVEFVVAREQADAFGARVLQQAADSLNAEPGCRVFDVCVDPEHNERYFLYEVYDDAAAFERHLASAHFKAFDADVTGWVTSRHIEVFSRLDAAAQRRH